MFKNKFSIVALIIAFVITVSGIYFWNSIQGFSVNSPLIWTIDLPNDDTAFGGIFAYNKIDDSLPHREYKRIEDSLNRLKINIDIENKGSFITGQSLGCIGVYSTPKKYTTRFDFSLTKNDPLSIRLNDSLDRLYQYGLDSNDNKAKDKREDVEKKINERNQFLSDSIFAEKNKDKFYYLALNGYSLKNNDTKFYITNGAYYLAYVKWDTLIKRKYDSSWNGHYESKQIKIRYAVDNKQIFIPISKTGYNTLQVFIYVFLIAILFLLIYFFIGLPIQLLINISRGKAFTKKNISILKSVTIATLVFWLIDIFAPYLFRLFFWKMIPADFELAPFFNRIIENLPPIFIGITLFFITKAFKRGYKLQQDQTLTI